MTQRRSPSRLLTLVALCTVVGCSAPPRPATQASAAPDDTSTLDGVALLSRYPQSPALVQTRDTYVDAAAGRGRDAVFMTTWFPGPSADIGEWSAIDPRGQVTIYRFVHDFGFQDRRSTSVLPAQLPELASLLNTLPASGPPKALDHLLIVGFRGDSGTWHIRLYDRTDPPVAVRRIFREMTGATLGTE